MFCYLEVGWKKQNRFKFLSVDNFPGRFSTCNLVFVVSGGRPLQQNLFEKNRINIYICLQTLSLNVTYCQEAVTDSIR